jgi:hypothetical protein
MFRSSIFLSDWAFPDNYYLVTGHHGERLDNSVIAGTEVSSPYDTNWLNDFSDFQDFFPQ